MQMGGRRGGLSAEMNVTPMIDVLLVLIIIFLMITPMHQQGLDTQIPQKPDAEHSLPPPETTIVIQVQQRSVSGVAQIKINQQPVSWSKLKSTLQAIYASRTEKVAFVQADDNLDFQTVASVIDVAHGAGVSQIGLMTSQGRN